MDIQFFDRTEKLPDAAQKLVAEILEFAGDYLQLEKDTEVSVTFMNNQQIQEINRDYRKKDVPTDVISFAMEELGEDELPIIFEDGTQLPRNLGDLFISTERAKEQALDYGHSFERELGFLALHGFLHLNGYDHMTPEDEKAMFALQREVLDAYGLQR